MRARGPFDCAQGRLFDFVGISLCEIPAPLRMTVLGSHLHAGTGSLRLRSGQALRGNFALRNPRSAQDDST